MSRPTLTVAMPNYNHARFLPRAIEGILNQTRPPDEFLILDDASTDNSVPLIEDYARQHSLIHFLQGAENLGVIGAHEKLYRLAKGDYLYSAAADDDRDPRFFERAMNLVEQHPQAGLVFGKMATLDDQGREVGVTEASQWKSPQYVTPTRFLSEFLEVEPPMQAMTGATIFRRDAFEAVGWCRGELGSFADTFATRAIALTHGACYVPERCCLWHRQPGSFSDRTNDDARFAIDIVARAVRLMEGEFAHCFPPSYTQKWAKRQRRQIAWNYLLGSESESAPGRPSFWKRNLRRLPRLPTAAWLLTYRGSLDEDAKMRQ